MHKLFVRGLVAIGAVAALSGQASTAGMTLRERVDVADFVGVARIQSVHPSPDATQPDEQRQGWSRQTADAEVTETIKGGFSTCVQGQYAIHDAAIDGWPGSAGPVALGVARSAIASMLPR